MQAYIGIDWSEEKHDIVIQNEMGGQLAQLRIAHSVAGLQEFEFQRAGLGLAVADCIVGLETTHHLVIDFLWGHGYQHLYVLPPNLVHSSQGRRRQSRARDDAHDAALIADILRTDRHRLNPGIRAVPCCSKCGPNSA